MEELNSIFKKHIDEGLYPGVEWKIKIQDQIYEDRIGYMDLNTKEFIKKNSLYRIWSMTKPIVSVAVMQLVEEKKIYLNDPISKFLPQFSNLKVLKNVNSSIDDVEELKQMPTIKNLLLHTAGFSYNFLGDAVAKEYDKIKLFSSPETTLEEEINNLSKIPLLCQPKTHWFYSVATDILGRIIEIVTNKKLQTVLKQNIFDPIGMNDTDFYVPKNKLNRLMKSYEFDSLNQKLTEHIAGSQKIVEFSYPVDNMTTYARGGHGLFSSLDDYSLFAQMLLTGKTISDKIILSNETMKEITQNHLDSSFFPLEINTFDKEEDNENDLEPYGWGLGFRTLIDLKKTNGIGNIGEFGWAGAAATYFLVDPKKELTAVLMTQVLNAEPQLKKDFVRTIYNNLD